MEDFRKYIEKESTKDKLKSLLFSETVEDNKTESDFDMELFKNSIINKLKSDNSFVMKIKGDKGERGDRGEDGYNNFGYGGDGGLGYSQVNTEISKRLEDYYNKDQVNEIVVSASGIDLSDYYTIDETNTLIENSLVDYYNITEVDNLFDSNLSAYYNKSETDNLVNISLSGYYNKTETDSRIYGLSLSAVNEDPNPRFGNILSGNYTSFEPDGTMVSHGDATVYDDLLPSSITIGSGPNAPSFTTYNGNLRAYEFVGTGPTLKELNMGFQTSHKREENSSACFHLHLYVPNLGTSGTIVFFCEYTWTSIGEIGSITPITISASTTLSANSNIQNNMILEFPCISGINKGISSMFMCRLYRDPTYINDTFNASVWLKSADIHERRNTIGSRQEYVK